MCIRSAEVRGAEESMVWDILCHECAAKADKMLDEREASCLLDVPMEEYGFCPKCTAAIGDAFEKDAKAEFGDEIP